MGEGAAFAHGVQLPLLVAGSRGTDTARSAKIEGAFVNRSDKKKVESEKRGQTAID